MLKSSLNYLDLLCFALLTLLLGLIFVLPPWLSPLRVILASVFILLAPGYALTATFFPKRDDIDGLERVVLSIGLSIASVSLVALVLNYTDWGIGMIPMTFGLSMFTLVALGAAILRRRYVTPTGRFFSSSNLSALRASVTLLAVVVLVFAGVALTTFLLRPASDTTEFYVLGSDRKLESYPLALQSGETFRVTLGIANYEGRATAFVVRIPLGDEEQTISVPPLDNAKTWEQTIELQAPADLGQTQLTFDLYREQDEEPYRSIRLFATVGEVTPHFLVTSHPLLSLC